MALPPVTQLMKLIKAIVKHRLHQSENEQVADRKQHWHCYIQHIYVYNVNNEYDL